MTEAMRPFLQWNSARLALQRHLTTLGSRSCCPVYYDWGDEAIFGIPHFSGMNCLQVWLCAAEPLKCWWNLNYSFVETSKISQKIQSQVWYLCVAQYMKVCYGILVEWTVSKCDCARLNRTSALVNHLRIVNLTKPSNLRFYHIYLPLVQHKYDSCW